MIIPKGMQVDPPTCDDLPGDRRVTRMKRTVILFVIPLLLLSVGLYWFAWNRPETIFAEMDTSKGNLVLELFYDKVPMTVANFIALAEGNHPLVTGERKWFFLLMGGKRKVKPTEDSIREGEVATFLSWLSVKQLPFKEL